MKLYKEKIFKKIGFNLEILCRVEILSISLSSLSVVLSSRVKKSESYSVNLHDGFPGKSMKNVPNIRLFSRIYTKKIHLSYFTFDSVIRTAYTYNSIKKNNRFRFVFNSNINQKYIGKVLVHEHS